MSEFAGKSGGLWAFLDILWMEKTHVNLQRIHSAQIIRRVQDRNASIDANQEIGPVLNIGIATILDVSWY